MKQVISASRRTDIPAYYLSWLLERLQQGFVEVRNPFYPAQSRRVDLGPDQVAWLVLWSRNFGPFLKKRRAFAPYRLYFHFTIVTPSPLEVHPADPHRQLDQLAELVAHYGAPVVNWRYDPLLFWQSRQGLGSNFCPEHFDELCRQIRRLGIERCTTSLAYPYAKFLQRLEARLPDYRLLPADHPFVQHSLHQLAAIARRHDIRLHACCTPRLEQQLDLPAAACVDGALLNQLAAVRVSRAKAPTRKHCRCTRSIDIGDYRRQPCASGCLYCYANPRWREE